VLELRNRSQGLAQGVITRDMIQSLEIPLPPLDEQKRISAILDKADQLRQKRRKAIALLDSLTQSIFLEMFGDPNGLFEHARLDQVCSVIRDGAHATPKYVESGIPFITVKNITSGSLSFEGAKWVSQDSHAELTKRVKPERGDILVSKDGTIGVPALIETDEEFSIFVSVALLKPNRNLVNSAFLVEQLRTDTLQRQIRDYSKGVAIRHLHLTDFRRLQIILPKIEIQDAFVKRAKMVQHKKLEMMASLLQQEHLFASLQHRAFTGQL
jgi:type I restriction enzyme, S subunit